MISELTYSSHKNVLLKHLQITEEHTNTGPEGDDRLNVVFLCNQGNGDVGGK